jgi:hypothetical protein
MSIQQRKCQTPLAARKTGRVFTATSSTEQESSGPALRRPSLET